MRYLYGDSVPFPPQYNLLAALETFVANAARAVQLDAEVRAIRAAQATKETARKKTLDELSTFHAATLQTLEQTVPSAAATPTRDYARQLVEHATRIVDDATKIATLTTDQERAAVQAEVERRRAEAWAALAAFLVAVRLPATETQISMRLQDGRNELSAVFTHPRKLVTSFALATRDLPAWQHPRKVSEFAKGIDLPVGVRKSWFGKAVQPEMVHMDEYIFGSFDLGEERAEMYLRRKPQEKDTIVLTIRRDGGELVAEMHHPGDPDAAGLPTTLDAEAIAQLDRLWQLLRAGCADVLGHKERLVGLELEGEDVAEKDRVVPFVELVIHYLAPIVAEIAKRSPNPAELSLKEESERGRREEIYVKTSDLASKLDGLKPEERKLFAPLSLGGKDKSGEIALDDDDIAWDAPEAAPSREP